MRLSLYHIQARLSLIQSFSHSPRSGSTRQSSSGRSTKQNMGRLLLGSWTVRWRGLPRLAPRRPCYCCGSLSLRQCCAQYSACVLE